MASEALATGFGSRKALIKCLFLAAAVHELSEGCAVLQARLERGHFVWTPGTGAGGGLKEHPWDTGQQAWGLLRRQPASGSGADRPPWPWLLPPAGAPICLSLGDLCRRTVWNFHLAGFGDLSSLCLAERGGQWPTHSDSLWATGEAAPWARRELAGWLLKQRRGWSLAPAPHPCHLIALCFSGEQKARG